MAKQTKIYLTAICMVVAMSACRVNVSEEVLNHPILKTTFDQEKAFRIATGEHIEEVLASIKDLYDSQDMWDPERLQKEIKKKMVQDLEGSVANRKIRQGY